MTVLLHSCDLEEVHTNDSRAHGRFHKRKSLSCEINTVIGGVLTCYVNSNVRGGRHMGGGYVCKAVCSHRKEVARQQCEATVRGPVRARVRQPPCELALREMNSHFYGVPHCVIATLARRRICSHFPRRSSLSPLIGRSRVLTDFDQTENMQHRGTDLLQTPLRSRGQCW